MNKWEIESKITSNFDGMLTQGQQEVLDYIEELEKENKQFQQANVEFVSQNNKLQHRIYSAIEFIDQELQYHLSPFEYKQVDEDINTLIGILRSGSNENNK
jgi:hypothetical protein